MAVCGSTVPDKTASGDKFYGPLICPQDLIDFFWTTYAFTNLSPSEGGGRMVGAMRTLATQTCRSAAPSQGSTHLLTLRQIGRTTPTTSLF